MFKKKYYLISSSIISLIISLSIVFAVPGTWAGYAHMGGSAAADDVVVTGVLNNASWAHNTSIGGSEYDPGVPQGYYALSIDGSPGDYVNFRICGILVSMVSQDWSSGSHYNGTSPNFNLSVSKLTGGTSCSYSCACSGNYCCSGATEYTDGTGSGTCQASACAAATTTAPAAAGGGGGGGGVATTTAPVTTAPAVTTEPGVTTEPKEVTTIPPSLTTKPKKPWVPLGIELSTIQIVGIVVGVVVVLALIIFMFVRFQAVRMAT